VTESKRSMNKKQNERRMMKTLELAVAVVIFVTLCEAQVFAEDHHPPRGPGGKPPSPKEWVEYLDKDGDGKVSQDEFDGPCRHFSDFDLNCDGYITEDEAPKGPPPGAPGQGGPGGMHSKEGGAS